MKRREEKTTCFQLVYGWIGILPSFQGMVSILGLREVRASHCGNHGVLNIKINLNSLIFHFLLVGEGVENR